MVATSPIRWGGNESGLPPLLPPPTPFEWPLVDGPAGEADETPLEVKTPLLEGKGGPMVVEVILVLRGTRSSEVGCKYEESERCEGDEERGVRCVEVGRVDWIGVVEEVREGSMITECRCRCLGRSLSASSESERGLVERLCIKVGTSMNASRDNIETGEMKALGNG